MKVNNFLSLLYHDVFFSLKAESERYYLSYLWWLVEPILHVATYYVVFGLFLNNGQPGYVVFLVCGVVPWLWFRRTMSNSMSSLVGAKPLVMQVRIPKLFFLFSVSLQDAFKEVIVLSITLVFVYLNTKHVGLSWLWLFPLCAFQYFLTLACASLAALVVLYMEDMKFLVNSFLQSLMFASGIFFSYEIILPKHRDYFFMNPIATIVQSYREILIHDSSPDMSRFLFVGAFSIILLCCSFAMYGLMARNISRRIINQ